MTYTTNATNLIPSKGTTVNYPNLGKQFLVIHSTANPDSTAKNNADYFNNNWSTVEAFTQLIVDDAEAWQVYPNGQKSWGAGNVNGYSYSQIEICEFTDDNRSKAAIANAVELSKAIISEAKSKGIDLQVISHHEANMQYNGGTTHTDPDDYFARFGYTMAWFRNQITAAQVTPNAPAANVKPSQPIKTPAAPQPNAPQIAVDGYLGTETWKAVQTFLDKIGYKLTVDGINGPATTKALQQALNAKLKINLVMDGIMGQATIKALQRLFGTVQDGVISKPSPMVKAWQNAINSGKNWI